MQFKGGKIMQFTIDFLEGGYFDEYNGVSFNGIDLDDRWNGWMCPAFDRKTADEIASTINLNSDTLGYIEYHDSNNGGYYTISEDGIEVERYNAIEIEGIMYYPIGAYCWTWEIVA